MAKPDPQTVQEIWRKVYEEGYNAHVLMLCEQDWLVLYPDVLYLFQVDPNCPRCREKAKQAKGEGATGRTSPP